MKTLLQLQKRLEEAYRQYKLDKITQKEYLILIKPIDREIDKIEMSTLQDIPDLRGSFLQNFQMQAPQKVSACMPVSPHYHP